MKIQRTSLKQTFLVVSLDIYNWYLTSKVSTGKAMYVPRINVTLRNVRVTIFAVEKQYVLHILSVCSLSYPSSNPHAPHYDILSVACLAVPYVRHSLTMARFSGKNVIEHKMCVWFSTKLFPKTYLILRKN
jgi:hypothetical protein